jgi:hypothetical protein
MTAKPTPPPSPVPTDSPQVNPSVYALSSLSQSQADPTVANGIATGANPGVTPPNYILAAYYNYHHRLGENVRCAPILLGMEDPTKDLNYPSKNDIVVLGPDYWLLENKQTL